MAPGKCAGPGSPGCGARQGAGGASAGAGGQVRRTEYIYVGRRGRAPAGGERRSLGGTTGAVESDLTSLEGHSPEPEVLAPTPSLSR